MCSFAAPITVDKISAAKASAIPAKTLADTKYCIGVWKEWHSLLTSPLKWGKKMAPSYHQIAFTVEWDSAVHSTEWKPQYWYFQRWGIVWLQNVPRFGNEVPAKSLSWLIKEKGWATNRGGKRAALREGFAWEWESTGFGRYAIWWWWMVFTLHWDPATISSPHLGVIISPPHPNPITYFYSLKL